MVDYRTMTFRMKFPSETNRFENEFKGREFAGSLNVRSFVLERSRSEEVREVIVAVFGIVRISLGEVHSEDNVLPVNNFFYFSKNFIDCHLAKTNVLVMRISSESSRRQE